MQAKRSQQEMANDANTDNAASYTPTKRTLPELNVLNVVLGNLLIKPWYPSFYPKELVGQRTERLYVCQWCFKYSKELVPYVSHLVRIDMRSFFIDGKLPWAPLKKRKEHFFLRRFETRNKKLASLKVSRMFTKSFGVLSSLLHTEVVS